MALSVSLAVDDDALVAFRAVLRALAETIDRAVPEVMTEQDPEDLHDLRVALRRTRSVLGEAKGVLPKALRVERRLFFKWLGEVTGPARDLDVFLEGLEGTEGVEGLRAALHARQRTAHDRVNGVLAGSTALEGLAAWRGWLAEDDRPAGDGAIGPLVARRLVKAQRTVIRGGRRIDDDTPVERVHDLRKDAKRLRYELECFGGLFPAKALKTFVGQLKALQDNLGSFQDAEVQLGYLHLIEPDLEVDDRPVLAELRRRIRAEGQAARDAFAERFAAYDTEANAAAFTTLVESVRPSGPAPASARRGAPA